MGSVWSWQGGSPKSIEGGAIASTTIRVVAASAVVGAVAWVIWHPLDSALGRSFGGQAVSLGITDAPVSLIFTPHLTPMIRGIHATLYARLTDTSVDLQALFEKRYAGEPFVDVMPAGSMPDTRSVRAANVCRIAVHRPQGGDMALVLVVEDNLVKGAAGQAIQNMNLLFGLPESTGLAAPPVLP